MTASTFDTLSAARDLEAAGTDRDFAEAIAKAIDHGDERAATKADLETVITGLRADIYHALQVQGAGLAAIVGGFITIAAALELL